MLQQIFGYLDPKTLLAVAQVCRVWNLVSEDNFFWQKNLAIMKHNTSTFCSCGVTRVCGSPAATLKRQYYHKVMGEQFPPQQSVCSCHRDNASWGYFKSRGEIRVVLFGPGLDSAGTGLVNDLMWGKQSPFVTLGMFPNSHSGIGGGVKLQYGDTVVNLVTLYRATKKEREAFTAAVGRRTNRIIDSEFMLEKSKVVATEADAFIYVGDKGIEPDTEIQREFEVLVGTAREHAPVLLLMPEAKAEGVQGDHTCSDYVDAFKLTENNRRWWLQTVDVHRLESFRQGLDWLLKPAPEQPSPLSSSFFPLLSKFSFPSLF